MAWTSFKVCLRMKTDMHCGSLMLGFVARAFPYVPLHVPLFAAVPAAVEALGMPRVRPSYKEMEDLLFAALRTTPFYVLDGASPLFPWNRDDLALLQEEFMSSRYGVTLDDSSRSAREGQLFETEVLLAHRRRSMASTLLQGFVWIRSGETERLVCDPRKGIALRDGSAAIEWPTLFGRLSLGGDRTRTLGCLWPDVSWDATQEAPWGAASTEVDSPWPRLHLTKDTPCPVPVLLDETPGYGSTLAIMTGRRLKEGRYVMDNGSVVHEVGWRPAQDIVVELEDKRCAHCVPSSEQTTA